MRFSEMVSRSLAARIESMMVVNDASTSGGTSEDKYQLIERVLYSEGEGKEGREGESATYKTY